MSAIDDLIRAVRQSGDCEVRDPTRRPSAEERARLPADHVRWLEEIGQARMFPGGDGGIDILPVEQVVAANPLIRMVSGPTGDISDDWVTVAKVSDATDHFLTMDLGPARLGRVYDSFWDRHAIAGSTDIIAMSFTDLIARILAAQGRELWWTLPSFARLGDAYDEVL